MSKKADNNKKDNKDNKKEGKRVLNIEKDFIEFAKETAEQISGTDKKGKYIFTFLKNSIELLAPSLKTESLSDLQKTVELLYNQKTKEQGKNKKGKNNKTNTTNTPVAPPTSAPRGDQMAVYKQYGNGEKPAEEQPYNEEEDFM